MSFLRTLGFLFFRKMEKNLYRGYILVRHKMGKTAIEIFEDLCLAYYDSKKYSYNFLALINHFELKVTLIIL